MRGGVGRDAPANLLEHRLVGGGQGRRSGRLARRGRPLQRKHLLAALSSQDLTLLVANLNTRNADLREEVDGLEREVVERVRIRLVQPGVGERIVLELKDRLPRAIATSPTGDDLPAPSQRDDVLSALLNLGYHRPLAEKAVDASLKQAGSGDFEQLLRRALRELAR